MLKEILIIMIVIISILLLNWYLQDYTKNSVAEINNQLEELKQSLKDENSEEIAEKFEKVKENWKEHYGILAVFIEHDELEKVEIDLVSLEGYIESDDYGQGLNELNKSIFSLKHIAEKYDFSLVNVF